MKLHKSTILITGGTSGIGLEFVKQLLLKDATIIITGRDLNKLEEVKKKYPQVHIIKSDVAASHEIEHLHEQVVQQFPALNILINNAGIMRSIDLQDTSRDMENITREIGTNLSGAIHMFHRFLPHLRAQTSAAIVNVSSGLAFIPFPPSPIYSAAKAGLHAYTRVLRLQLKNTSIKVFELAPPQTETPLLNEFSDLDPDGSGPVMKVEKLVSEAIKGILKDNFEIKPGMSKNIETDQPDRTGFLFGLF
ncbi:SDR family oxidoreductase [Mucilaginibacter litoreus]|uniref:SDR family oxidoreductase n=1 Tax=Mucilaginibacter litoreus TaxID=1048221 RepID=A0ABW3AWJ7_9SPHI